MMRRFTYWVIAFGVALACQVRAADPGAAAPFSGTAVDGQGRPVADAEADCYLYSSELAILASQEVTLKQTKTDSQGAFSFSTAESAGVVVVKKAGLATAWASRLLGRGGDSGKPLVLAAPAALAGKVVDDKGQPVAGAEVWVSIALDQDVAAVNGQPNILFGRAARDSFSARTAADGRFRIESFPANGQANLSVAKKGMALRGGSADLETAFATGLQVKAGDTDIKLVMEPAASIEGKVAVPATGQALAGVKLRLQPAQASGLSALDSAETVTSGADGTFVISDVAAGSYKVTAEFESKPVAEWVAQSDAVTVTTGQTARDVQVRASKGGVLEVRMVSKMDQKPVPGVNVLAINPLNQGQTSAVTDANGMALLRLAAGQWTLVAVKQSWGQQQQVATVVDGETNRVEMETTPPLTVKGTVRGPAGEPVAGAILTVGPNYGQQPEFTSDANGHYEVTWAMQSYGQNPNFSITARSQEKKLAGIHDIDETTRNLDLQLQPALTISAKVVDPKGKPIPTATARLMVFSGNMGFTMGGQPAQADHEGRVRIETLPQGQRYQIMVSAKGYGSVNQPVEETATQTASYEFPNIMLPEANLKLAGQVLGTDGKPAAGIMVQLNGEGQPNGNTKTDATGHFRFDAVCDGPVTLFANAQGAFANAQASGGDTGVVLRLANNNQGMAVNPSGTKITGIVNDASGAPVAGVELSLFPNWAGNTETKTDANGRYTVNTQNLFQNIQIIRQQNMTPTILARSLERNLAVVHDFDEKTTNLDLRLEEGMTISAKVQDADGQPIKRAMASLLYFAGRQAFQLNGETVRADDNGEIRIQAVPQGQQYQISITASGYGSDNQALAAAETQTANFECKTFVLRLADRPLAGQVVGADGKAVSRAQVNISGQGQPNGNMVADVNGHFSFTVCEGPVTVFAYRQPTGNNGEFLQGNIQAYGGDTNLVVTLGSNLRQGGGGGARTTPLKPAPWTWAAISAWPGHYPKAIIVLLSAQAAALLAAAGGIFWVTRKRNV